jgi:hypothetical protein
MRRRKTEGEGEREERERDRAMQHTKSEMSKVEHKNV